jgi:hypothetical protein
VPDSGIKFNSDIWIPEIKSLCLEFCKNLQKHPGGRFLKFRDDLGTATQPGKIVKEYHKTVKILKKQIFAKETPQSHIDYHKIASLYIRSFLKYKPFYLNIPKETKNVELCLQTMLSNEYFVIPFLEVIFRAWNDDFEGLLRLDRNYRDNFIKLLHYYKNNIDKLDPVSFSNTIYLIEQQYFHLSKHGVTP